MHSHLLPVRPQRALRCTARLPACLPAYPSCADPPPPWLPRSCCVAIHPACPCSPAAASPPLQVRQRSRGRPPPAGPLAPPRAGAGGLGGALPLCRQEEPQGGSPGGSQRAPTGEVWLAGWLARRRRGPHACGPPSQAPQVASAPTASTQRTRAVASSKRCRRALQGGGGPSAGGRHRFSCTRRLPQSALCHCMCQRCQTTLHPVGNAALAQFKPPTTLPPPCRRLPTSAAVTPPSMRVCWRHWWLST